MAPPGGAVRRECRRGPNGYFPLGDLIDLIAFVSRDLVRAAALAWITFLPAARSSFFTSVPKSASLLATSLAVIDFADLAGQRANAGLGGTVAGAAINALPQTLLGTGCIWHGKS